MRDNEEKVKHEFGANCSFQKFINYNIQSFNAAFDRLLPVVPAHISDDLNKLYFKYNQTSSKNLYSLVTHHLYNIYVTHHSSPHLTSNSLIVYFSI